MSQDVVIWILVVVAPRIVAEDGVDFQKAEQEDQTADQFVPRYIAHAVVVVVQGKVALQSQDARLFVYLAFVPQNVLAYSAGFAYIVAISSLVARIM